MLSAGSCRSPCTSAIMHYLSTAGLYRRQLEQLNNFSKLLMMRREGGLSKL